MRPTWRIADRSIVINTTPLIALAAAGGLDALPLLYQQVIVPLEVAGEIEAGGKQGFGVAEIAAAGFLDIQTAGVNIPAYLANALDRGEAAVIATAIERGIPLVCIDETVGRRVARLAGLTLTGSLGVLIKAKQLGFPVIVGDAIRRMREQGIWLSREVAGAALALAGERKASAQLQARRLGLSALRM